MSSQQLLKNLRLAGSKGLTEEEILLVYETLETYRPDFICEWGTNVGHSARMFYECVQMLELRCEIHSVDIVDKTPVLRPSDKRYSRGYFVRDCDVTLHVGDGVTKALKLYRPNHHRRPLFFLDDNHEEEAVFSQIQKITDKIPHAVILVHDVCTAVVLGGQTHMMLHEPGKAVMRFLSKHKDYELTQVLNGQTMMRMRPL